LTTRRGGGEVRADDALKPRAQVWKQGRKKGKKVRRMLVTTLRLIPLLGLLAQGKRRRSERRKKPGAISNSERRGGRKKGGGGKK